MKLLIVTQKVDQEDENLGAFYCWFRELAKQCEKVVIIADYIGKSDLPANVSIYSLGKERQAGRLARIWNFCELFCHHYARTDAVLFQQIPEYVLAAAPFLLALRRTSGLWYAHKSVTWKLKMAERLVDWIFTSSPEGFRLPSKKVLIVGQAISPEVFAMPAAPVSPSKTLRLLTVGRISPVKNIDMLIRACSHLKKTWEREWLLSIVGGPLLPKDHEYLALLKKIITQEQLGNRVHFLGTRPYRELPSIYQEHDLFLNLSHTGSLDKAVLESMASGLSVVTSNEAFRSLLPSRYFLDRQSPEALAERIKVLADEIRPNAPLREIVLKNHNLQNTVGKIKSALLSHVQ